MSNRSSTLAEVQGNSDESTEPKTDNARNDPERSGGERTPALDDSKVPFLTLRVFTMAVLASMGGFIFGYDTGQISGFLEMQVFLERFGEQGTDGTYHFSNVRSGLIVGLLSIGTLIGCLIAGPVSNKFGRKTCIPFWCLIFCIGVTIQMSVSSGQWVGIAMGRWVAGLGVGGLSVLVPLYMSETAPKQIRGAVTCSYQLFITIGIFTADAINYGTEARTDTGSYRIPMGVGYIWAIILGVGILFMPESTRWDFRNSNYDRAYNTITKMYGVNPGHVVVATEVKEINEALDALDGSHPWWEVFTGPRMGYRTLLAMAMQSFQQLTGANYFFYYGTTVFAKVGIENSYVTAMILGGVNVSTTFLGLYMVEHFGRRKCLFFGALWMFVCFMIFASIGHFEFNDSTPGSSQAHTSGIIMILFACLFITAFASTWGPMVWTVIGEMFPYRYRAVGMGLATSANWFWNFCLAFFTPFITHDIDYAYGYVFAGCNLAAALLVYFFLVESAGKTLEEVDFMYIYGVSPIKSSKFDVGKAMAEAGEKLPTTDSMYLGRGAKRINKRSEANREGAEQYEGGVLVPQQKER